MTSQAQWQQQLFGHKTQLSVIGLNTHPNIGFDGDRNAIVEVDHFRRSVGHCSVSERKSMSHNAADQTNGVTNKFMAILNELY